MNTRHYKNWLADKPCAGCGMTPVQLHHVKGAVSLKTGQRLRPRSGPADLALIPLCPECHIALHGTSEEAYEISFLGGIGMALGWAFTYFATWNLEGRP